MIQVVILRTTHRGDEGSDSDDEDDDLPQAMTLTDKTQAKTLDLTNTDLVDLRRKIYLVIMSSLDFEECAHKLMMLHIQSTSIEICTMVINVVLKTNIC